MSYAQHLCQKYIKIDDLSTLDNYLSKKKECDIKNNVYQRFLPDGKSVDINDFVEYTNEDDKCLSLITKHSLHYAYLSSFASELN